MKTRRLLSAFALAAALSGCGKAQFLLYRAFGPDHHYAPAAAAAAAVPPPPAPGSPEDRKDLAEVLAWQARRSASDCAAANAQAEADYDKFFGGVSPFPDPLPPEVSTVLFRVFFDGSEAVALAKDKYSRPRPFRRDKAVEPCLGRVPGLSYPSGHATLARLFALLLSDVDPARRAAFLERGDRAALNRVIGGAHHPSDIEAGKLLGDAVYAGMKKSPAFAGDLEKLRKAAVRP